MKTLAICETDGTDSSVSANIDEKCLATTLRQPEVLVLVLLLIVVNVPIVLGVQSNAMIFFPDAIGGGQWWRLVTHPFAHVSWYHLFLDASAFFALHCGLREASLCNRLLYIAACAASSLFLSWLTAPEIQQIGLCGLSGVAHGIMAISCLELIFLSSTESSGKRFAVISLAVLLAKCIYEAVTGKVVLAFLHFGLYGTPIAVCHAGGAIGGVLIFCLVNRQPFSSFVASRISLGSSKLHHC